MVPYTLTKTISNCDSDKLDGKGIELDEKIIKNDNRDREYFKTKLIWTNIIAITILHTLAAFALLTFPYIKKIKIFAFGKCIKSSN